MGAVRVRVQGPASLSAGSNVWLALLVGVLTSSSVMVYLVAVNALLMEIVAVAPLLPAAWLMSGLPGVPARVTGAVGTTAFPRPQLCLHAAVAVSTAHAKPAVARPPMGRAVPTARTQPALTNHHSVRRLGQGGCHAARTARGLDGHRNHAGLGEGTQAGHVRVGVGAAAASHVEHHGVAQLGGGRGGGIVQLHGSRGHTGCMVCAEASNARGWPRRATRHPRLAAFPCAGLHAGLQGSQMLDPGCPPVRGTR